MASRTCPHGHIVSDPDAQFCPSCGSLLAEPQPDRSSDPITSRCCSLTAIITLLPVLACIVIYLATSNAPESSTSTRAEPSDIVNLHLDADSGVVYLARSEEAHRQLMDIVSARDTYGLAEMLVSGDLYAVPENTKACVLARRLYIVQVRILEGAHEGRLGWVVDEAVD